MRSPRRGVIQALVLAVALTGLAGPSFAGGAGPQPGPSAGAEGSPVPGPSPTIDGVPEPEAAAQAQVHGIDCTPPLGTDGDDVLNGTEGDDVLCGFGGKDTLNGMGGDDILFGGEGDDILLGGAGSDYLQGGEGSDELNGGSGPDTCRPASSPTWEACEAPRARDGRTSTPLDITVAHGPSSGSRPEWRFVTRRSWSRYKAWDDGFFMIFIDQREGPAPDKVIVARTTRNGRGYVAHVYRLRGSRRELQKDRVRVSRPNGRNIVIRAPWSAIGLQRGRNVYRWFAMSSFNGKGCRRGCFDAVQARATFPEIRP